MPARYLLQIAAAALTAVTVREMSALVGDPMVAAMLTLILALPFALALFHSPTKDRRRS